MTPRPRPRRLALVPVMVLGVAACGLATGGRTTATSPATGATSSSIGATDPATTPPASSPPTADSSASPPVAPTTTPPQSPPTLSPPASPTTAPSTADPTPGPSTVPVDAPFLTAEELPDRFGLAEAVPASADITMHGPPDEYLDLLGEVGGGQRSDPPGVDWQVLDLAHPGGVLAGILVEPDQPRPAWGLLQGLAASPDAAALLDGRREALASCPDDTTWLVRNLDDNVVTLDVDPIGDEVVAWRVLGYVPEAILTFTDVVWWRHGDRLGSVVVEWSPGAFPWSSGGLPEGEEPTEPTPDEIRQWLEVAGATDLPAAAVEVARELDARLPD